jgi:hypothetical protein
MQYSMGEIRDTEYRMLDMGLAAVLIVPIEHPVWREAPVGYHCDGNPQRSQAQEKRERHT